MCMSCPDMTIHTFRNQREKNTTTLQGRPQGITTCSIHDTQVLKGWFLWSFTTNYTFYTDYCGYHLE